MPQETILFGGTIVENIEYAKPGVTKLERLMEGRTSFIIVHRLSTIHNAERIIVLDKGKLIESGNHRELMDKEGLYHKLYTLKSLQMVQEANTGSQ